MTLGKAMWLVVAVLSFGTLFLSLWGKIELGAAEQVLLTLLGVFSVPAAVAETEDKTS